MINKYLRFLIASALVLGIVLLAKEGVAWAGSKNDVNLATNTEQSEPLVFLAGQEPGSVKPPPKEIYICEDGMYSIGGVVVLNIKNLNPSSCIEAVLWNPRFQIKRIPEDAGRALAHMLFLRIYYEGKLIHELPAEDGSIESCYALPPETQGQFYFYNFYGMRFKKLTQPPTSWESWETRVDTDKKTVCAFTQFSGVYGLIGN